MITTNSREPIVYQRPSDAKIAKPSMLSSGVLDALKMANEVGKGVMLHGPTGTGKTFAMLATAPAAFWIDWPEFVADVRAHFAIKTEDAIKFDPIRFASNYTGAIVIDDLGAERDPKGHGAEVFDRVVSARARFGYLVSVTTNLKPADIDERYGSRCASRLAAMCAFVELGGADRRLAGAK